MTQTLTAIEAHAEGEPGRVIVGGMPELRGTNVFEKMQDMAANHDHIRTLMLQEPRGYPALCCNALVPPCDPSADAGFIIMEQSEYPPMSGSNTICVVTVLLETGILPMVEPVTTLTLETPAGVITVKAACRGGKVTSVEFLNVPAFAVHLEVPVDVPGLGRVSVDIAWGGMFYVLADADRLGIDLSAANGAEIVAASEAIRHATRAQYPVVHPENDQITGPTITNLYGATVTDGTHGRGAITLATGAYNPKRPYGVLDRSPCGTGTCAKMAVLHARGLLGVGQDYVNAGPMGTTFTGRITGTTQVGPYEAIIPTLSGQAWIYGRTEYSVDSSDPFQSGFTVGDLWA